jgi:hypothetical protein
MKHRCMRYTRLPGFFALGFLAFLLQGCFNPITADPPQQSSPADPFTMKPSRTWIWRTATGTCCG